jgi:hypothetical protein
MRRLLGDLVDGRVLGDTTSLQDESVPGRIREILEARAALVPSAAAVAPLPPSPPLPPPNAETVRQR